MRNKLELALISVQNRAIMAGSRMKDRLTNKENGDSNLVVVLLLIAIAVGLCITFRSKISDMLDTIFNTTQGKITEFTGGAAGGAGAGGAAAGGAGH